MRSPAPMRCCASTASAEQAGHRFREGAADRSATHYLPALGVITFAIPALAQAYLAGDAGAMTIADSFLAWPRGAMTYPAVLAPIGAVLLAVVMWRTRAVPRLATGLFAVATILIAVPI